MSTNEVAKQTQNLLRERDAQTALPVWFRAPSATKHDPIFSLTRAKLYQLNSEGHIQSVSLREKHQQRATRLFLTQSVSDYIARCAARAEAAATDGGGAL